VLHGKKQEGAPAGRSGDLIAVSASARQRFFYEFESQTLDKESRFDSYAGDSGDA
jgi:hypothetical protein